MPTSQANILWTIGHSTRSIEDFVALLAAHEVAQLVDVRRYPGSRRHPQFGRDRLQATLSESGLGYTHLPALGGRRTPLAESANSFWKDPAFRGFADHMASEEAKAALERVLAVASHERVAIMCAEAVPWHCHRQVIADWVVARGWQVEHLLAVGKTLAHVLNPGADVSEGGEVRYPGLL